MKINIKLFCRIGVLFVMQTFAAINAAPLEENLARLKSSLRGTEASIQKIQAKLQDVQASLSNKSGTEPHAEPFRNRLIDHPESPTPNSKLKTEISTPKPATDQLTYAEVINKKLKTEITTPAAHSTDLALKTTYHGSDVVDKVWSAAKLAANFGKSKEECNRFANAVAGAAIGDALGRVPEAMSISDLQSKFGITKNSAPTPTSPGIRWFDDINHAKHASANSFLYSDDTVMAHIVFEVLSNPAYRKQPRLALMVMTERFANLFDTDGGLHLSIDQFYWQRVHGLTAPTTTKIIRGFRDQNPPQPWTAMIEIEPQNTWKEYGCGSVMRVFPVGFFYSEDLNKALYVADAQSQITHRDLVARAACAAFVAGFVALCKNPRGATTDEIADAMIDAAALYDQDEMKTAGLVRFTFNEANIASQIPAIKNHIIAQDWFPGGKMLTSDMLRYAKFAANAGIDAETVLGKSSDYRAGSGRTTDGTLLGWRADEAVAAALYIFMLHPGFDFENFKKAMQKSLNTVGDNDSIATLVGALLGYRFNGNIFDLPRVNEIEWYDQMRALRSE